jgi:soluble lytic murein transglycosylase-like protein
MRILPVVLFVSAALPLLAGEHVLLASGARLRADRHERSGGTIRLFAGEGVIELPAQAVVEIEEFLDPRPEAAPAMPSPLWNSAEMDAAVPSALDPRALVRDAALRSGLPPQFVESVAKVESAFQPGAVSPKGAIGVMQLMPKTAKALDADPHDLRQNIEAGTRLLRELLLKYDGDVVKALSAYNAGEGAVARYQGMPPYTETRRYVDQVIRAYLAAGGK